MVIGGMIHSFGKERGISCFDAALMIYDHQLITAAVKSEFAKRGGQIEADEIASVCRDYAAAQRPKIPTPETLPPMIDLAALRAGHGIVPIKGAS